jgi:hypothetical protein
VRRHLLLASLAAACGACDEGDLHRIAGIPQGTLVVGLGMPMGDVARRSTVKLHKLPTLGLPNGNYADGNAYFDFELAGSSVRFHGCSMYSIDYEGPREIVTSMSVFITPKSLRWRAFQQELRDTAGKLKADGWEPYQHDGWPALESFLSRDGSKIETTPSDVVATFDWKKGGALFRLSAHRAWDGPDFWSSFELYPADLHDPAKNAVWWPAGFPQYPDALGLCSRNTPASAERKPGEPTWSMFGTRDEPADVIAFYAAERGLKLEPGATTLRLESKDGKTRLMVYPIDGGYKEDCGVHPSSWARTILIASEGP